jgi:beta-N-acetylhexosaminidase
MSPKLADLLTRIQPAGVILFARNIINAQQTHKLLKDCRALAGEPLFTCVDLEGGRVDRFRNVFGGTPSAAEVFSSARENLFRKHGEIVGQACRGLGFNVDFAPVLDLAFAASRTVMSSRAFSTDPEEVVGYAREFLAGLSSAGVIGAGKHFPGLGEGNLDSHHHLPVIRKSFKQLWEEDLAPYRIMKRELPMVLVNHASDDMEMGGVLKAAPMAEAAVEFIRAGGDLCLICHEQKYVESGFEAMVRECERAPKFRRRVEESAKRVAAFKRKHARRLLPAAAPSPEKIARLSRRLWEFTERVRFQEISSASSGTGR